MINMYQDTGDSFADCFAIFRLSSENCCIALFGISATESESGSRCCYFITQFKFGNIVYFHSVLSLFV